MWLGDPAVGAGEKQDWVWGEIERKWPGRYRRENFPVNDPHTLYAMLSEDICKFMAKPGDRVMDIGANCGVFTTVCAMAGATVWAFDPHPEAVEVLRETVRRNGVQDRVMVSLSAITVGGGEVAYNPSAVMSDGWLSCNGTTGTGGMRVASMAFAEALRLEPEWDCVKMDVEGDEFGILLGTGVESLRRVRYLTVEMHYNGENIKDYPRLLEKLGEVFEVSGEAQEGKPYHSLQGRRR